MSKPLVLVVPFVLAAARSLTLGIWSPDRLGSLPMLSAEKECEFLTIVAFCLFGLTVALNLIFRFPEFGALIAEYNQF